MLGKTNNTEADKSVISSDMKIKGKISADGELVLLGSVVGDIKCHSLSVEGTGNLKGNIDADMLMFQVNVMVKFLLKLFPFNLVEKFQVIYFMKIYRSKKEL